MPASPVPSQPPPEPRLPITTPAPTGFQADRPRGPIRWLVALTLAELVFLQHGRLWMPEGPSVRIALYAATVGTTVAAAALLSPAGRSGLFAAMRPWLPLTVALLGLAVPALGTLVGLAVGTPWRQVLGDANGHAFHLIAIPMVAAVSPLDPGWLVRILSRIVCCFCAMCLVVYAAAITSPTASHAIEVFLRTRDLGFLNEFTDGRPYRLFFKSFIFVLAVLIVSGHKAIARRATPEDWITLALTGLVLGLSFTRSIWLVAAVGLLFVSVLELRRRALTLLAPVLAAALAAPLVAGPEALGLLRLDDRDGTIAIRLAQVSGLGTAWIERPLTGAGFGTPISPGSGFAIELDLLNLLRKIGLAGLAFYVIAFWTPLSRCRRALAEARGCPDHVAVFLAACLSVFGLGMFNPYATASLGVGLLAIGFATLSAGEAAAARPAT